MSHPGAGVAVFISNWGRAFVSISFIWALEKKNEHEKRNHTTNLLMTIVRYLANFKMKNYKVFTQFRIAWIVNLTYFTWSRYY